MYAKPIQEHVERIVKSAREKGKRADFIGMNLREAHLSRMDLSAVDFIGADLTGANLIEAKLDGANFSRADLSGADLIGGKLIGVNLIEANLSRANLIDANLIDAKLRGARLNRADLSGADLGGADLTKANLSGAELIGVNLIGGDLSESDLRGANLVGANLIGANLIGANLTRGKLVAADLSEATLGFTTILDADLRKTQGLEVVVHRGPSYIDVHTLYRSGGGIPEAFLRGAGVPETFITFLTPFVKYTTEYPPCFISYASEDEAFAEKLHTDLQKKGVSCWCIPEDLEIGSKIRSTIDPSVRMDDKLLLVLSRHSVASSWVKQAVKSVLAQEQSETALFLLRLDEAVLEQKGGWTTLIQDTHDIGDFTLWHDEDAYQESFTRLLQELEIEAG